MLLSRDPAPPQEQKQGEKCESIPDRYLLTTAGHAWALGLGFGGRGLDRNRLRARLWDRLALPALTVPATMIAWPRAVLITVAAGNIGATAVIFGTNLFAGRAGVVETKLEHTVVAGANLATNRIRIAVTIGTAAD